MEGFIYLFIFHLAVGLSFIYMKLLVVWLSQKPHQKFNIYLDSVIFLRSDDGRDFIP